MAFLVVYEQNFLLNQNYIILLCYCIRIFSLAPYLSYDRIQSKKISPFFKSTGAKISVPLVISSCSDIFIQKNIAQQTTGSSGILVNIKSYTPQFHSLWRPGIYVDQHATAACCLLYTLHLRWKQ
jgi:hypothetical protein